jgi:hypothetical protein
MKYVALAASVLIVMVGCSSEPSSPTGTLPVVQNLTVDETASKGDTVVLHWNPLDVEVDGYHVWWSSTSPGSWHENVTEDTTLTEIAENTRYYYVKASKGLNYSSGNSNQVDTRATQFTGALGEPFAMRIDGSNGIEIFDDGEGGATGTADSSGFNQDFYIAEANNQLYFYSGDHNPAQYPGGRHTPLCHTYGNVAPEPGSTDWVDSVLISDNRFYFGQLSNGYYIQFYVDTTYTNGADINAIEYQTISALRLFNVL